MPFEDTKILEFKQHQKSNKAPFIIYLYLECLIKKTDRCKNNFENSYSRQTVYKTRQTYSIKLFNVYNIDI